MDGDRYRVVQLQRRPHPQQVSIERVFEAVREHLPSRLDVDVVVSSWPSSGLLPRVRAVLEARRHQGDVTHVVGDVHYLTLFMRRRTTVLTVHDTEFLDRAGGAKAAVYRWLWLRLPVLRSAVVTVPSEQTRRDLERAAPASGRRVRVVPNPVRAEFGPTPLPGAGPPRVLLMGTWPNKNVERSARALAGLGCRISVVGHLDDEQRRLLRAADPDLEEHAGLDDDAVVALYRRCSLLLFPSLSEGFGVPVLEAQASGRPVVTSDRPPMSEVSGGAAELVDPTDVDAVRAGVRRVLDDAGHRAELVARGLENAARYRPQAVAAAYTEVYDAVRSASRS